MPLLVFTVRTTDSAFTTIQNKWEVFTVTFWRAFINIIANSCYYVIDSFLYSFASIHTVKYITFVLVVCDCVAALGNTLISLCVIVVFRVCAIRTCAKAFTHIRHERLILWAFINTLLCWNISYLNWYVSITWACAFPNSSVKPVVARVTCCLTVIISIDYKWLWVETSDEAAFIILIYIYFSV